MHHQPQPPSNPEAELAVLGSFLMDPGMIPLYDWLQPDQFYNERNGWIYAAMLAMRASGQHVDIITLTNYLDTRKQLREIGGEEYIMDLLNAVPTSAHAASYAKIVHDTWRLRMLIRASGQVAQLAWTWKQDSDLDQIVEQAEQLIFTAGRSNRQRGAQPISSAVMEALDEIDARQKAKGTGVHTGFKSIDHILGGMDKGEVTLLAARPGVGKSAFMLNVAHNNALLGKRCVIYSLEMAKAQLVTRMIAMAGRVPSQNMRLGGLTEDNWVSMMGSASALSRLPILIDDTPARTITSLRSDMLRLHAEMPLDLVVVDYLQLLYPAGRIFDQVQVISEVSKSLKNLSRELDVPVLALSQLSRAVESRATPKPQLSDLRGSGSLEQDAAQVIFLFRPDDDGAVNTDVVEVSVAKNRMGQLGDTALYFDKPFQSFRELVRTPPNPGAHASRSAPRGQS